MSDLVGTPEDRFSRVAAQIEQYQFYNAVTSDSAVELGLKWADLYASSSRALFEVCWLVLLIRKFSHDFYFANFPNYSRSFEFAIQ